MLRWQIIFTRNLNRTDCNVFDNFLMSQRGRKLNFKMGEIINNNQYKDKVLMLAEIACQFEEEEKINFDWKYIKNKQRIAVLCCKSNRPNC